MLAAGVLLCAPALLLGSAADAPPPCAGAWASCAAALAVEGATDDAAMSLLQSDRSPRGRRQLPVEQQMQELLSAASHKPADSCRQAMAVLSQHREDYSGAYGAPVSRPGVLRAGVGEVAALGLLGALASEDQHERGGILSGLLPPGAVCWSMITMLGVQYDHNRSLLLYKNSPHLWDAIVAWNRRVMGSHDLLRMAVVEFAGLYGKPPNEQALVDLGKAGGFDVMFDVLQNNVSDLVVAQAAWAGLSDNVENFKVGAQLAADHGGPTKGLETLVGLLKHYRGRHAYQPGGRYGLRYESVHVINGILMFDDPQGTWTEHAVAKGFCEEAALAMKEEPDELLTQENGCEAIALTARSGPASVARLREAGAVELAVRAIERFQSLTDDVYRVPNSCATALLPFAKSDAGDLDEMRRLGLARAMDVATEAWGPLLVRADPWGSLFPWSNVEELRALLETGPAA